MNIVCGTHGHCFDGLASATVFSAWMAVRRPGWTVAIRGFGYGTNQAKPSEKVLSGDENAILDYRYEPLERLTYYFDHHPTAFANEASRAHFETRRAREPGNFVFEKEARSCTKLLHDALVRRGELESSAAMTALVEWADVVDSARFSSAAEATNLDEPRLQLVHVVEQFGDDELLGKLATRLLVSPMDEVASSPLVRTKFDSLRPGLTAYRERVKVRGEIRGSVVLLNLLDETLQTPAKFVQYSEFPAAIYSIIVSRLSSGIKISVGHNPWSGRPCEKDIGALCARFGGGGHFMVGGIAFPRDQAALAEAAALEICGELA